ncbi:hypothetical protein ES705_19052 [subsurface metagenome]
MVKCLVCGKELKNEAGLAGHMQLLHPSARPVETDVLYERMSSLEALMGQVVEVAGLLTDKLKEMDRISGDTQHWVLALVAHSGDTEGVKRIFRAVKNEEVEHRVRAEVSAQVSAQEGAPAREN